MAYVKWTIVTIVVLVIAGFLHYTLPQHDVVRITATKERQITFGENRIFFASNGAGNSEGDNTRFVNFIETFNRDGKPVVFRNEDTGWGWPPYFKFDTSNLQAKASDMISTKENPEWVVVTHYGWRNEYLSIYPNAVELRPVGSPDDSPIPWFNILFLGALAALVIWIWQMLARFKEDRIEPMLDEMGESLESAGDRAEGFWRRVFSR
ncbi:DUF1523 family protein [Rhodovulum kholense]|uniref:Uncharacterized protein DUF1523 n=1 Tax=Rhodovulum kholense TaxID=453584 RepID=A0A8E3AQ27_9RHOB|nr:DUF1523 family protein [Rhodovulum kholense]PTW46154.1 uncharacterized protein DUF1523 [Rhodovulum kholense]